MDIKNFIRTYFGWTYRPIKKIFQNIRYDRLMCSESERLLHLPYSENRIFYLGVVAHVNLGDLAQQYCILNWLKENYPSYDLEMFTSDSVVNEKHRFINNLKSIYRPQDIIVFQSGYTTQDLGGYHNLMHEKVVAAIPSARILMLPQTVYFQKKENQEHTAKILNSAQRMLFLARDFVSFETAKEMMPNVVVKAFPDIVTTLIGTMTFDNPRNGVCLCTRNDGEKYYTKEEIDALELRLNNDDIKVYQKDTQSTASIKEIRSDLKGFIEREIESYSHYEVTITDRYHGTIFSLCAGTPVIIIKTTDHKVTTGADWFKGVYDGYVFVVDDLNAAYEKAKDIISININHNLKPFFKVEYYNKLKCYFEEEVSLNNNQ